MAGGTEEVMLAIFSGTYATVVVLVPIIFIGGYVQTVLRPLSLSLTIALIASYVVSVTIIPILAPYGPEKERTARTGSRRLDQKGERQVCRRDQGLLFGYTLAFALKHRFISPPFRLLPCSSFSSKVVKPLIGRGVHAAHGYRNRQNQL